MFYKFSEHAIIQDLNFPEQLWFWAFSIPNHVLNFDLRANLTRTYEEKKYMLYIWITKGYFLWNTMGEKHIGEINCTFGAEERGCSRLLK